MEADEADAAATEEADDADADATEAADEADGPTLLVAAPYALPRELVMLSPVSLAAFLRAIARSSLRLEPCGTLMPFLSAHSLISDSDHASKILSDRVC